MNSHWSDDKIKSGIYQTSNKNEQSMKINFSDLNERRGLNGEGKTTFKTDLHGGVHFQENPENQEPKNVQKIWRNSPSVDSTFIDNSYKNVFKKRSCGYEARRVEKAVLRNTGRCNQGAEVRKEVTPSRENPFKNVDFKFGLIENSLRFDPSACPSNKSDTLTSLCEPESLERVTSLESSNLKNEINSISISQLTNHFEHLKTANLREDKLLKPNTIPVSDVIPPLSTTQTNPNPYPNPKPSSSKDTFKFLLTTSTLKSSLSSSSSSASTATQYFTPLSSPPSESFPQPSSSSSPSLLPSSLQLPPSSLSLLPSSSSQPPPSSSSVIPLYKVRIDDINIKNINKNNEHDNNLNNNNIFTNNNSHINNSHNNNSHINNSHNKKKLHDRGESVEDMWLFIENIAPQYHLGSGDEGSDGGGVDGGGSSVGGGRGVDVGGEGDGGLNVNDGSVGDGVGMNGGVNGGLSDGVGEVVDKDGSGVVGGDYDGGVSKKYGGFEGEVRMKGQEKVETGSGGMVGGGGMVGDGGGMVGDLLSVEDVCGLGGENNDQGRVNVLTENVEKCGGSRENNGWEKNDIQYNDFEYTDLVNNDLHFCDLQYNNFETDDFEKVLKYEETNDFENNLDEDERRRDVPNQTTVKLQKSVMGLGFFIQGGKNSPKGDQPISVKRVTRGDVDLDAGDIILTINGVEVGKMTSAEAWGVLKEECEGGMVLSVIRKWRK